MSKKFILLSVLLGAVGSAFCLVENRKMVTDEYTVKCEKLPKAFEGKRILHLSDLHKKRYGDGFANLLDTCEFCKPDYILFTGDLLSHDEVNLIPKIVLMQRLMKIAPVYYIMGNHETEAGDKTHALNVRIEREGVKVLRNENEKLYCGDDCVRIYGADLPLKYYIGEHGGYQRIPPVTEQAIESLLGKTDSDECNILLSHLPMPFGAYIRWGADIVFSGHCHGGIIRIPIIGGLLSPERKFFPKYTKGVYKKGGKSMVVSAGLGKFRINNPSQIVCVTLTRGE